MKKDINKLSSKKLRVLLILIFLLALIVRFYHFSESTYFGYDEARDAFISQSIYTSGDLKLIGPPANYPGLFHGPLYWYLIGPIYLLGKGNPYFVSAFFRVINCFGVFLIFVIGKKLFNERIGLISAFFYAISFEQSQYAMYVGNPSLAVLCFMGIFMGTSMLLKDKNPNGLLLMFVSAAVATQLELILLYTIFLVLILLFLFKDKIKSIHKTTWLKAFGLAALVLSTFIAAEFKYHFQSTKAFLNLLKTGYNVMPENDSRLTLFGRMFIKLFQYNILYSRHIILIIVILVIIFFLIYQTRKTPSTKIVLIWMFAPLILLPFGGYDALYVNVGIGVGIILTCGSLLYKIQGKSKMLSYLIIIAITFSNLLLIKNQNPNGLIVELKPQPFMKLSDELKIIDRLYSYADGQGFTTRVTGIPYNIQTVWAYLFNNYGKTKWGYLPYWETGIVEGYPGSLPTPQKGTTCIRYLIRDPERGLPEVLIQKDIAEENLFSKVIKEEKVGHFLLQTRKAHGDCHNTKAIRELINWKTM